MGGRDKPGHDVVLESGHAAASSRDLRHRVGDAWGAVAVAGVG
jgi:hypothetical protein